MNYSTSSSPRVKPIHPGEILREEFMIPLKLSAEQLANDLQFPLNSLQKIIDQEESLNEDIISRLSAYFELPFEFWWNLQKRYELGNSVWKYEANLLRKNIKPYKEVHPTF